MKTLSINRKNALSKLSEHSFFIFKELDCLCVYGESLIKWLELGGIIKNEIQLISSRRVTYFRGVVSLRILFQFVDASDRFELRALPWGYQVIDLNAYSAAVVKERVIA